MDFEKVLRTHTDAKKKEKIPLSFLKMVGSVGGWGGKETKNKRLAEKKEKRRGRIERKSLGAQL